MKKNKTVFYFTLSVLLAIIVTVTSCSKLGNGPIISSIVPSSVATGDDITITGKNLSNSSILIGGVTVLATSNTSTSIETSVPGRASLGVQEVKVTNSEGSDTGSITIASLGAPPVITSISPDSVSVGGQITITGTGLKNAAVEVYTIIATVSNNTATSITATIPAGVPAGVGQAAVRVTTPLGDVTSSVIIK